MKPECFGFLAVYDANSDICKSCPARQDCVDTAYERGVRILNEIDIRAELAVLRPQVSKDVQKLKWGVPRRQPHKKCRSKKRFEPSPLQQQYIKGLPTNVRSVVEQCYKRGIDVQASLRSDQNPFRHDKPAFMEVACDIALKRIDGFTTRDLQLALSSAFDWSEHTTKSKAWIAISVLKVFGLSKQNGRYFLERAK